MLKRAVNKVLGKAGYHLTKLPPNNREQFVIEKGKSIVRRVSPDFKVLNGPFKGLQYPSLDITEAALVPKIIGTYEAQLHSAIRQIISTPYNDIIDIGCAEGYYAVGFAARMPETVVHCFDVNQKDLEFCRKMASRNNADNLTFNNLCTTETLMNFNPKVRGLIFCDCEGCELELFTPEVIKSLTNVDVLVEMHDVINPVISAELLSRFQRTHQIQVFNNLNVSRPHLDGLEQLTEDEKEFATLEHRGGIDQNIFMEWAFLTAKGDDN